MELQGVPLSLPTFVSSLRPHQEDAVKQIVEQFQHRRVVFLDAPTGSGKTIIGEVTRQMMQAEPHRLRQCLYVCTTKSLQEQVVHDFPYAKVIKGRSNYTTLDNPGLFDQLGPRHVDASYCTKTKVQYTDLPMCEECEFSDCDERLDSLGTHDEEGLSHCNFCHPWQSCPYEIAKTEALKAQFAVANTAYFLTEANYVGRFGKPDDDTPPRFPLLICDEADTLESVLMGFVEVSISGQAIKQFGLKLPSKKTVAESWVDWCVESREVLNVALKEAEAEARHHNPPPIALKRKLERLDSYLQQIKYAERSLRVEPENWVWDHKQDGVVLKPVKVSSHTQDILWKHSKKWLLMSATTISPHQMADDLGLGPDEWGFVEVDSNFPPERRPIKVAPLANMTNKTKDTEWPKMVRAVESKLDLHRNERVLIHTVSYAWTKYLYDALRRTEHADRLLTYEDGRQREGVLESYKQRPNAVLIAPSFDRGIDLPDDLCRAIIITKVPFPNLGDEQVRARFYGTGQSGKGWYATQTIRSIVQMTGRGMRHKDDFVVSYILDSQFSSNLWSNAISRNRLPKWWVRALQWDAPRRSV